MKKLICLLLCAAFLLPLLGCAPDDGQVPVFYYLRNSDDYVYGTADGVVAAEERDVSGQTGDIKYLLTLYLQGPVTEGFRSPFPQHSVPEEVLWDGAELTLILSHHLSSLEGMDQTLACVCLARTCFSLTDAQSVRIMVRTDQGFTKELETVTLDNLFPENILPTEDQ